jgi:hypothetical protein
VPSARPEASMVAPAATVMTGVLLIEPAPLNASVPALTVVLPV